MWLKAEGFVGNVKSWWEMYSLQATPSYILAMNFKSIEGGFNKVE